MRRSVFFLTPLIPLAVAACEDGPNQTFQPATGTLFNNGDTPASVTDAGDPLNSTFNGSTTTQICGGSELQEQWGAMIAQPLAPVRFMAGLDMDNGPTYPLLTVEQAELGPTFPIMNACVSQPAAKSPSDGEYGATPGATPLSSDPCLYVSGSTTLNNQTQCAALAQAGLANAKAPQCGWNAIPATPAYLQANPAPTRLCQPVVLGQGANGSDVGGSILVQWGNNGEFQMEWAVPTHKAYVLYLNPGYNGQMQWNYVTPSDKKIHQYQYEIAYPIKKDGAEYVIDWLTGPVYPGQVDELYRGIASTYAPDIYDDAPTGVTCNNTGTCLAYANAEDGTGRALFGMRPVSFYMFFNPPTLPNPSGYTVQSAYLFNIKYAPYSGITSYFKMYDGPLDGGGYGGGYGGALGGDAAAAEPFGDGLVGNKTPQSHCHFGMGNNFLSLLTNCIDVFQTPTGCTPGVPAPACDIVNVTAQNKVLGDISHDDQNYTFAVVGINQNFRPVKLDVCNPLLKALGTNCGTDTQDVIHDTDSPLDDPSNNFANTFDSDVRSFGAIQNDYFPPGSLLISITAGAGEFAPVACTAANGPTVCNPPASINPLNSSGGLGGNTTGFPCPGVCDTSGDANSGFCVAAAYGKELHGSGAVWREYGRLVQTDMNSQYVAANGGGGTTSPLYKAWHDPSCYFPETCNGATGSTPSTCAAAGGAWGLGSLMTMSPQTSCTTDAQCAAVTPGATCNTAATGFGLLHDTCVVPFDVNTWRAAPGCTGFEGWFTAAEQAPQGNGQLGSAPTSAPTPADDLWDNPGLGPDGLGGGFKPGTPQGMFCNQPGGFGYCGLSGDIQGLEGDLLGSSTSRLLQYLGNGNILQLPLEGRDRRYFFKQWSTAYAKYLISPSSLDNGEASAGAPGANGLQVDLGVPVEQGHIANQYIDSDDFIFDSFGGGASRSEYIDFDLSTASEDPVDVEQKILVLGSNLQATNWYRKLDREERALFNVLAVDKTQPSWGYLNTSATSGVRQVDFWPADVQPATPCTTTAQCTTATASYTPQVIPGAPPLTCDTNPAASDANSGACGYAFPKHNANPFLTNLAGSAILVNGDTSLPAVWQIPLQANPNTSSGLPLVRFPAPAGWVDPCNPLVNLPATCNLDTDCPGVMSCTANKCVAAITPYYCATHSPFDPNAAGCASGVQGGGQGSWFAPLNSDNATMVRRANGKPLLEGYCSVWQPNPFSLQTNAITPSALVPSAPSTNPNGVAAGIQIVKTFPDEGEALVSLPTFPNPYNEDPTLNKSPVLVMVPWLPQQEGVGYPVAANGSQDVFVETAQLDFTGQVITPTMDFFATGTNPPYGVQVQAWETQDFLGQTFLCIDNVTGANRAGLGLDVPGDMLYAGMYTSAETIIDWLSTHPGAQNSCQIIVRYSPYDNYPDFITSLTGGVRLDIEQGAGYGRVVDATVFAPGTGVAVSP